MESQSFADFALRGLESGDPDFRLLYKYQRISEHSLDALRNRYLYFSSPEQLNDPFDPFLTLMAAHSGEAARLVDKAGPKVFCASEESDSPLMWAHYGDSGRGMCVGYAVFVGNLRMFHPVEYRKEFTGKGTLLSILLMKSHHWKWEAEWRAILPGPKQKFDDIAHAVTVCVGPRCSTEQLNLVQASLPSTVAACGVVLPSIEKGVPTLLTYNAADVVERFGGMPSLREMGQNMTGS